MRYWELFESPKIINATDFGLSNQQSNLMLSNKLMNNISEIIRETDDYTLFISGDVVSGYVAMISKKDNLIKYLIKYEAKKSNLFKQTVTQVALWRDIRYSRASGITEEVFFDVLLKKFPAIMSDSEQTERGKEFWIGRMAKADEKGFKVGFVNNTKNQLDWFDSSTEPIESWLDRHGDKWSTRSSSKFDRFVISN